MCTFITFVAKKVCVSPCSDILYIHFIFAFTAEDYLPLTMKKRGFLTHFKFFLINWPSLMLFRLEL